MELRFPTPSWLELLSNFRYFSENFNFALEMRLAETGGGNLHLIVWFLFNDDGQGSLIVHSLQIL